MLDGLVQQSSATQGYADQNAQMALSAQNALGESFTAAGTSSTSNVNAGPLQTAITGFFGTFQTLASTPNDATDQQLTVQSGSALASAFSSTYSRLQQAQSDIGGDASDITTQINSLAQNIAQLNQQIRITQASQGANQSSPTLIDSREADLEKLNGLVNVTTTAQTDGTVNVALADNSSVVLVSGQNAGGAGGTQTLSASFDPTQAVPLTVSGSTTGALAAGIPSSGSLGADLNVANNVIGSPSSVGNSGMLGQLDTVANQIITQVNTQSAAGFDANGNAGGAFFSGTGASSMAVDSNVVSDPSLIATGNGSGALDGSNALAISQLQSNSGILPAFQQLVTTTGAIVSNANTSQTTQDQAASNWKTQQNSYSGVSIDEEMTNLINYQQAYAASARFVTTVSNLFNTLLSAYPASA
jgi:flagellar hook-associated protein 1 FlgK